jgi:hypothetical protein
MAHRQERPIVPGVLEQPAAVFPNRCSKLASDQLSVPTVSS